MTLPTMLPHTRADVLAWCRGVDDGAWASLAVPERITYTSHDITVQLAAAAALTERVRLWTTIVILPAHDAVAVAKQMASVDVLSDGRLTMGVGIGGREHDYRAINASFARRFPRMDEQVATMRRIWNGEPPFDGADPVGPPPVQPGGPPLIAGVVRAEGDRARGALGRRRRRRVDARREPRRDGRRVRRRSATRGATPAAPTRRTCRRASGTRSVPMRRSSCRSYAYDYLKIFGDDDRPGRGVDGHVLRCRRVAADARRTRATPAPTSSSSSPPPPTPTSSRAPSTCSATSTTGSDRMSGDTTTSASVDRMLEEVAAETGLDDFGDPSFRDGLERVWSSGTTQAGLTELGLGVLDGQCRGNLRNRLRVTDWHHRHPEVAPKSPVAQPICIVGLSRTGTTALSHLLACDPDNRSLLGWEAGQSVPPPDEGHVRRRPAVRSRARGRRHARPA